ncbi:MAG TPA: MFS transporter, partial [Solirubrobacteraceae bacterium]
MRLRPLLLAGAAGLALADGSIVTLALPEILSELDTTVQGVAAVIGVYTVVLAAAVVPLERAATAFSVRTIGAGGLLLFAVASAACAGADDLTGLLIARAAQALGGAAGLVAAFALLGGGATPGRRAWVAAAVLGTAIGPALGGALTELFSWRAIFVFQAPVAGAAALAALVGPMPEHLEPDAHPGRFALRPVLALGLVSAALSAVLFLLVLLLVAGWSVSPVGAAAAVTVVPLAAAAGTRIAGPARVRAAVGSALIGGGVLAIAWLPGADVAWTLAPQALAGVGMGMALTALAGGLLPERTTDDAARTLAVRHAGIAVALAVLAPVVAAQLDASTQRAREQGVALVLDARLNPQDKLALAPALLNGVDEQDPRDGLRRAAARERARFSGDDRREFDSLARRADETLTAAVADAFDEAFLISGALALLAAAAVAPWPPPRRAAPAMAAAAALAVVAPLAFAGLHGALAPEPVAIQDPCNADRDAPDTGGVSGFLQDRALQLLDASACRLGSSREELVLALADADEARRFEDEHGVDEQDPRDGLRRAAARERAR